MADLPSEMESEGDERQGVVVVGRPVPIDGGPEEQVELPGAMVGSRARRPQG